MMEATYWQYEKLQEDGKIKTAPINDYDGKITGHIVFGVKQWFDENPEEARRLGWVKHIMHNISKWITYDKQTQYLVLAKKIIDEYTYEDEYHIMEKTEAMMRREEENIDTFAWTSDDGLVFEWGNI